MRVLILFFFASCSMTTFERGSREIEAQYSKYFNYTDSSGKLTLKREFKVQGNKFVSRNKLLSKGGSKELESVVAVSKLGYLKSRGKEKKSLLPEVSQFKVWFDKKEYFSQIKLDRKLRLLSVVSKSPEPQWNFDKNFKLPSGKYYCFYSQLPECLKLQNLLFEGAKKSIKVFVIWENFPYHNEQYEGLGNLPYVDAVLKLDKHDKNTLKYSLDLGNQLVILKYDKDLNFVGYFWISQGISAELVDKEL